jgi:hypothetical protein
MKETALSKPDELTKTPPPSAPIRRRLHWLRAVSPIAIASAFRPR